jgi:trehalose utilization protein
MRCSFVNGVSVLCKVFAMPSSPLRVTIWNEFIHEQTHEAVRAIYPDGIHATLAAGLSRQLGEAVAIRTATLKEPNHGIADDVLDQTDVLLWWGHQAHDQVSDDRVDAVQRRVLEGMGLIALHSAHASKVFRRLMGTGCMLRWREAAEKERLWITAPGHPITEGLAGEYFELPETEMYGEYFDIPQPDELIFISWFAGGEVFRSGCTFRRGRGKIFYFRPGHETYPIYHHETVQLVIANAVRWAAPAGSPYFGSGRNIEPPLESLPNRGHSDPSLHR